MSSARRTAVPGAVVRMACSMRSAVVGSRRSGWAGAAGCGAGTAEGAGWELGMVNRPVEPGSAGFIGAGTTAPGTTLGARPSTWLVVSCSMAPPPTASYIQRLLVYAPLADVLANDTGRKCRGPVRRHGSPPARRRALRDGEASPFRRRRSSRIDPGASPFRLCNLRESPRLTNPSPSRKTAYMERPAPPVENWDDRRGAAQGKAGDGGSSKADGR